VRGAPVYEAPPCSGAPGNRATNIELQYREHVEKHGGPPEQAGRVIEDLAAEAERLMSEVIVGEEQPR
jgi:hypothetical protein